MKRGSEGKGERVCPPWPPRRTPAVNAASAAHTHRQPTRTHEIGDETEQAGIIAVSASRPNPLLRVAGGMRWQPSGIRGGMGSFFSVGH